MNQETIALLTEQWKQICSKYAVKELEATFQFVQQHSMDLVSKFYTQMMKENHALEFLSMGIVHSKLQQTLNQWLLDSFEVPLKNSHELMVKKHQTVGHVHARVGIPSWLIMRGIREIEKKVFELLPQFQQQQAFSIATYMIQVLSFSSEIMCRSYEANLEVKNDMKHTYRLFSAMQDVATQKEKQRGSLLDWENELMFKVFSEATSFNHQLLSKSEFGLWFIHKAAYAFSSSEQVNVIIKIIHQVDLLNHEISVCSDKTVVLNLIYNIREKNREILHLVDQLFQVSEYIGSGNDSLTQLLNRRYLNTILAREIHYSRKNKSPLTMLSIDADHFKKINDQYGHAAGDLALQFLAEVILENARGSDYAFRVGGEEFLLLQVDNDIRRAQSTAESILKRVQDTHIQTSTGQSFNFSVSIGVVNYDGHPDYQRFLDAADAALYVAKNNGRANVYVEEKPC